MERNPTYPYIVNRDAPKLANLQRFPDLYRSNPVLVSVARSSN